MKRAATVILMLWAGLAAAAPPECETTLVLSGGGARGAAHIGVIEALEARRVRVDCVVGTSMGAIVGALYAAGYGPQELREIWRDIPWNKVFDDDIDRQELSYWRKSVTDNNGLSSALGLGLTGFRLPQGLIQGQRLLGELRRYLRHLPNPSDFDRLNMPFRAVATDIETGEAVVFSRGDLVRVLRASMAVPGVFAPESLDGRLLVDGGLVMNLPVAVAREMGAQRIIAVDVSVPPSGREQLISVFDVAGQISDLVVVWNTREQEALLREGDVLIRPALQAVQSTDFGRGNDAMLAGEQAVAEAQPAASMDAATFAQWQRDVRRRDADRAPLDFVEVLTPAEYAPMVEARISLKPGEPLSEAVVAQDLKAIYSTGLFERVDVRQIARDGELGAEVEAKPKSWGPNYLRLGFELEETVGEDADFNLAIGYDATQLNRLGAEWRTQFQFGASRVLYSEWYQPLDYRGRWFVVPYLDYQWRQDGVFEEGFRIAEFTREHAHGGVAVGRQLGNWGEWRLGLAGGRTWVSDVAGSFGGNVDLTINDAFAYASWSVDTLDQVYFPHEGIKSQWRWDASRTDLGADESFDNLRLSLLKPWSVRRHAVLLGLEVDSVLNQTDSITPVKSLGGFLRLSGLSRDQISGRSLGLARLNYRYKLTGGDDDGLLGWPLYLGASVEAGNVWSNPDRAAWEDMILAGSVYAAYDSPIGPVVFALGQTDDGSSAGYLLIGRLTPP